MASTSPLAYAPSHAPRRYDLHCCRCSAGVTKRPGSSRAVPEGRICHKCRLAAHTRPPRPSVATHHWALAHRTKEGIDLAKLWQREQPALAADNSIRGNVQFYNPREVDSYSYSHAPSAKAIRLHKHFRSPSLRPLVQRTTAHFRSLLAQHVPSVFAIGAPNARHHYLKAFKLLWSKPGEGLQPLHYDVPRRDLAAKCYSVLFYCTPANHTAVPDATAEELFPAFGVGAHMKRAHLEANVALFRTVPLRSKPVPAGAAMLFNTRVAHHGVKNTMKEKDRIVIYALFSPTRMRDPDQTQRFPLANQDKFTMIEPKFEQVTPRASRSVPPLRYRS